MFVFDVIGVEVVGKFSEFVPGALVGDASVVAGKVEHPEGEGALPFFGVGMVGGWCDVVGLGWCDVVHLYTSSLSYNNLLYDRIFRFVKGSFWRENLAIAYLSDHH